MSTQRLIHFNTITTRTGHPHLRGLHALGRVRGSSAATQSSVHSVIGTPGHIAVSFHKGRRFCVFDVVPAYKKLSGKEQDKLNRFVQATADGEFFPSVLALPTTDSLIVDMHFITLKRPSSAGKTASNIVRLMVVQRNGTFLVWEWKRTVWKWLYVSRGVLPAPTPHDDISKVPRLLRAVVVAPAPAMVFWAEDVVGARGPAPCRVYGCVVPALVSPEVSLPAVLETSAAILACHDLDHRHFKLLVGVKGLFITPLPPSAPPTAPPAATPSPSSDSSLPRPLYYYPFSSQTLTRIPLPPSSTHPSASSHSSSSSSLSSSAAASSLPAASLGGPPHGHCVFCLHPTTRQLIAVDDAFRLIVFVEDECAAMDGKSTYLARVRAVVQCTLSLPKQVWNRTGEKLRIGLCTLLAFQHCVCLLAPQLKDEVKATATSADEWSEDLSASDPDLSDSDVEAPGGWLRSGVEDCWFFSIQGGLVLASDRIDTPTSGVKGTWTNPLGMAAPGLGVWTSWEVLSLRCVPMSRQVALLASPHVSRKIGELGEESAPVRAAERGQKGSRKSQKRAVRKRADEETAGKQSNRGKASGKQNGERNGESRRRNAESDTWWNEAEEPEKGVQEKRGDDESGAVIKEARHPVQQQQGAAREVSLSKTLSLPSAEVSQAATELCRPWGPSLEGWKRKSQLQALIATLESGKETGEAEVARIRAVIQSLQSPGLAIALLYARKAWRQKRAEHDAEPDADGGLHDELIRTELQAYVDAFPSEGRRVDVKGARQGALEPTAKIPLHRFTALNHATLPVMEDYKALLDRAQRLHSPLQSADDVKPKLGSVDPTLSSPEHIVASPTSGEVGCQGAKTSGNESEWEKEWRKEWAGVGVMVGGDEEVSQVCARPATLREELVLALDQRKKAHKYRDNGEARDLGSVVLELGPCRAPRCRALARLLAFSHTDDDMCTDGSTNTRNIGANGTAPMKGTKPKAKGKGRGKGRRKGKIKRSSKAVINHNNDQANGREASQAPEVRGWGGSCLCGEGGSRSLLVSTVLDALGLQWLDRGLEELEEGDEGSGTGTQNMLQAREAARERLQLLFQGGKIRSPQVGAGCRAPGDELPVFETLCRLLDEERPSLLLPITIYAQGHSPKRHPSLPKALLQRPVMQSNDAWRRSQSHRSPGSADSVVPTSHHDHTFVQRALQCLAPISKRSAPVLLKERVSARCALLLHDGRLCDAVALRLRLSKLTGDPQHERAAVDMAASVLGKAEEYLAGLVPSTRPSPPLYRLLGDTTEAEHVACVKADVLHQFQSHRLQMCLSQRKVGAVEATLFTPPHEACCPDRLGEGVGNEIPLSNSSPWGDSLANSLALDDRLLKMMPATLGADDLFHMLRGLLHYADAEETERELELERGGGKEVERDWVLPPCPLLNGCQDVVGGKDSLGTWVMDDGLVDGPIGMLAPQLRVFAERTVK